MTPAPVSTPSPMGPGPSPAGSAGSTGSSTPTPVGTDGPSDGDATSPFEKIFSGDLASARSGRGAKDDRRSHGVHATDPEAGPPLAAAATTSADSGSGASPDALSADAPAAGGDGAVAEAGLDLATIGPGAAVATSGAVDSSLTTGAGDAAGPDAPGHPDLGGSEDAALAGRDSVSGAPFATVAVDLDGDQPRGGAAVPVGASAGAPVSTSDLPATTADQLSLVSSSLQASPPSPGTVSHLPVSRDAAPGAISPAGPAGTGTVAGTTAPPGGANPGDAPPGSVVSFAAGLPSASAVSDGPAAVSGSTRLDVATAAGAGDDLMDTTGLATSISGVLTGGNGNYNVVLNLHPPELGQVQARLMLRGDQLQVDLSPDHAAAHDALESALPALREHLAQGGMEVDVTLGDPGAAAWGAATDRGSERSPDQKSETDDEGPDTSIPGADAVAASTGRADRLHLVL
jgi:flagellar hook-length control protein FliK